MRAAVFLDRDGVLNRATVRDGHPYPPGSVEEMEVLPGVADALNRLHSSGFLLVVITNQPDVRTGLQRREVVESMHDRIRAELPLDEVKACYHVNGDRCTCRKPKPGMLLEAAATWSISLADSFMVGDRWQDIGAGRAAGCCTILIGDGYGEPQYVEPHMNVSSLAEAADLILFNSPRWAS